MALTKYLGRLASSCSRAIVGLSLLSPLPAQVESSPSGVSGPVTRRVLLHVGSRAFS